MQRLQACLQEWTNEDAGPDHWLDLVVHWPVENGIEDRIRRQYRCRRNFFADVRLRMFRFLIPARTKRVRIVEQRS